jgi:hypothetical protein
MIQARSDRPVRKAVFVANFDVILSCFIRFKMNNGSEIESAV